MNPDDYDEDGNNIVPCPICLNNYCPSKEDGKCPEEEDFAKWHTQKAMDVVYLLGSGSPWDNNEIRYSLRSLVHLPHDKVFVVGERPEWLQNIIHLDVRDNFAYLNGGKFRNVIQKIRAACQDERVSESFVLMNDDFFFLTDTTEIKPYANGTLESMIEQYPDKKSQYYNALVRTKQFLQKQGIEQPINYAVHYPIIYEKKKFLQMTDDIDWLEKGYSWRTIYGNLFDIGRLDREDPKVSSAIAFFKKFAEQKDVGDFLSISDNLALLPEFQKWIAERFPNKSLYETA
jgi:hypothetical protein